VEIAIANSAFVDLENIKKHYAHEGAPDIGKQFVVAIFDHIQTLYENPDIGRIVPEFDEANIRELIHPPFRIVYLREQSSIYIVRVWRSERLLILPDSEIQSDLK